MSMWGGDTSSPSHPLGKKMFLWFHLLMSFLIGRLFYPFFFFLVKVLSIVLHVDYRGDRLKSLELGKRGECEAADVSC